MANLSRFLDTTTTSSATAQSSSVLTKNNSLSKFLPSYSNSTEVASNAISDNTNNGGIIGGIGYTAEKIGLGAVQAIEGIADITVGSLAKLFGNDEFAEEIFANDWVNYNHADEWYNPDEFWQGVGGVANGIGTSLPGIAATIGIGIISGGLALPAMLGAPAMLTTFAISGLSAAGVATKEAYMQTGELGAKEFAYGALSGITEGAIETLSDRFFGGVVGQVRKMFGKQVVSEAARKTFGKQIVESFLSEGAEEVMGTFIDPYWKRLTYDPNAQNASIEELAYAGFIGGLSGAIMSGTAGGINNATRLVRGNKIASDTTQTQQILNISKAISEKETANKTNFDSFSAVKEAYDELENSLKTTDGEIRTAKQKMLLGELQTYNTIAVFEPVVASSAVNIATNAEQIAQSINNYGYTDVNGNKITVTAEELTKGIEFDANGKPTQESLIKALKTNSTLTSLAAMDATGRLNISAQAFNDRIAQSGDVAFTKADFNRFMMQASNEEKQALAKRLGVTDWTQETTDSLKSKITGWVANGGVDEYRAQRQALMQQQAQNQAVETQTSEQAQVVEQTAQQPQSAQQPLLDERYYSIRSNGNETDIAQTLKGVEEQAKARARERGDANAEEIKIEGFKGEMSEDARENYEKTKKAIEEFNKKSGLNIGYVVVSPNDYFNGALDNRGAQLVDGTLYISEDNFESNKWTETLVHELMHASIGTDAWVKNANILSTITTTVDGVKMTLKEKADAEIYRTYKDIPQSVVETAEEKTRKGEDLTANEQEVYDKYLDELAAHMAEYALGNEQFINKLVGKNLPLQNAS